MITTEPFYTAEQIRSRLGISTFVLLGQVKVRRESLKQIAEAGIATIEITDQREEFQEEDPSTMKAIVDICKEFGLSITSFHSTSINFDQVGLELEAEIERSKRMIDHLLEIGGRVWSTHVMIKDKGSRLGYEALAKYYQGEDVKLAIENSFDCQSIQECIDWIDSIGHPQIGILFDIGHERNTSGKNPMTMAGEPAKILGNIGHRLYHTHLHDFAEDRDHCPPFEGEIQWVEIFKGLKEIDYQGVFMFESRSSLDYLDTIRKVGTVPERIGKNLKSFP